MAGHAPQLTHAGLGVGHWCTVTMAMAASKVSSRNGSGSATPSITGADPAGRCRRMASAGSTATTRRSPGSYDPLPLPRSRRCEPAPKASWTNAAMRGVRAPQSGVPVTGALVVDIAADPHGVLSAPLGRPRPPRTTGPPNRVSLHRWPDPAGVAHPVIQRPPRHRSPGDPRRRRRVVPTSAPRTPAPTKGVVTPPGSVSGGHLAAHGPQQVEPPLSASGTKRYSVSSYPSVSTVPRPFTTLGRAPCSRARRRRSWAPPRWAHRCAAATPGRHEGQRRRR